MKLNILVLGAGSIGKRHIKNMLKLGIQKESIIVFDTRKDRLNEVKRFGLNRIFNNFEKAIKENFQAAIICSPTFFHVRQSIQLAKLKKHLLIEKPLSHNLKGTKELKKIVKNNKLVCMIAYIFRFSPSIKFIKKILKKNIIGKILYFRGEFSEYLPDWHPYEDYRSFYMARKKMGGGSILDQCHIMDLSHFLVGDFKSVNALNLKVSSLKVNADDVSELIIKHKNRVISSVHTDIFGRQHKKSLEIKGEKGNISWDFYKNQVTVYNPKTKKTKYYLNFKKDFNISYIKEMKHFLDCVKKNKKNEIPLEVGIRTMDLIAAAEKSQKSKREETV